MIPALLASFSIALLSLTGAFLFKKTSGSHGIHTFVLPIAVGVFLGVVFFELIPETLESSHTWGPVIIIAGFLSFYLLSHFLETFHHHHVDDHDTCMKNGAQKLLIGDTIHNVADGIVIASAFMINPLVGVFTTLGIALHEIPQEIAEFNILIRSGYTHTKAASYNFLSALGCLVGVFITYGLSDISSTLITILTGVAAGNLLYIATTDLIPELRESHRDHFVKTFLATLFGVACIGGLITYTHSILGEAHPTEHHEETTHEE